MTLVVLAAGMGSRYGGLKQVDPITPHGEFIIDFSVYDAVKAGFDKVVFIIKEAMYEEFHESIGKRVEPFIKVEYAFQSLDALVPEGLLPAERTKPLGTTHALLCAKDKFQDNFAVINSDDFYGREAYETIAGHLKNAKDQNGMFDVCMVGYVLGNTLTDYGTVSRGVCRVDKNGYLEEIQERTKIGKNGAMAAYYEDDVQYDLPYDSMVSMNFWGFTPGVFDFLEKSFDAFLKGISDNPMKKECYLPMSVGEAMNEGKCLVKAYKTGAKWFGVTYSEDKAPVVAGIKELVEKGVYPDGLWK